MTFFGRLSHVVKYNPYHDKDGKFTESGNAQAIGSLDGVANVKHDNAKALDAVMGVFQKKFTRATYKDHEGTLKQMALNAIGGHPGWDTATKTSFIMSQLKGHYSGFKTPSKEIRSKIETKVSYKAGNKMYKALHEAISEHELKADHGLTVEHVEAPKPEPVAPAQSTATHVPEPAKPAASPALETAKDKFAALASSYSTVGSSLPASPAKEKPATDVYTLTEPEKQPETAAPARAAKPLDLTGKTPMEKFKAVVSDHVANLAGQLPLTQLSGVVGKVHSAYMAAKTPEEFEHKAAFGVEDLVSTGQLGPSSANQIHTGDWKPLYGKLNDALTGKAVAPAAPAPAPSTASSGGSLSKLTEGQKAIHDDLMGALKANTGMVRDELDLASAHVAHALYSGSTADQAVNSLTEHVKSMAPDSAAAGIDKVLKPKLQVAAGVMLPAAAPAPAPAIVAKPTTGPGYGKSAVAVEAGKLGWVHGGLAHQALQNAVDQFVGDAASAEDLKNKVINQLPWTASNKAADDAGKMDWEKIANASMGAYLSAPTVTSTAVVPAAAKEPDVKPVVETSITTAQMGKPIPTGDTTHDLVMNMLHQHAGSAGLTTKEQIVASNLAKSNLGVSDDGVQFFNYVNTDLDNYAAKYPQNVPHLDALKQLPWDHVYADAKSIYGELPTDYTATDAALHAKSFPAAPAKAPEPAPAPAPDLQSTATAPKSLKDTLVADLEDKALKPTGGFGKAIQHVVTPQLVSASYSADDLKGQVKEKLKTGPATGLEDDTNEALVDALDWGKIYAAGKAEPAQSTATHAPASGKLPPLSVFGLDEELHNQLNNMNMKGQGSSSHKKIMNFAAKAFLTTGGDAAAFEPAFHGAIESEMGASAANVVKQKINAGHLWAAMKNGEAQTELSADAPKGGVEWKSNKVYAPGSQANPTDDEPDDTAVTNEMKAQAAASKNPDGSAKKPGEIITAHVNAKPSWDKKHKLTSQLHTALEAALEHSTSQYDLKLKTIQGMKAMGVKFGPKTKGMMNMLPWKEAFVAGQVHGLTQDKIGSPAAPAPSTTSAAPASVAGPKAKAALDAELKMIGYSSSGMSYAKISTAMNAALAAGNDFNSKDLADAVVRHLQSEGSTATASVAKGLDWAKIHAAHDEDQGNAPTAPAAPAVVAPKGPSAEEVKNSVVAKAKAAGINPYAVEQMGSAALLAHANTTTVDAQSFKANAHAELDAKVNQGVLKPSPSVDKLKNNMDWEAAYNEAGKTPAQVATPNAPPSPKLGVGDTSKNGDYPGFKRYDKDNIGLGKAMNQRKLSSEEANALSTYKGSGYSAINAQLRDAKMLSPSVLRDATNLTSATRAGTIPAGTVLYRGMPDFQELGFSDVENAVKQGRGWHDNGFLSVTSSRDVADHWSLGGGGSGPHSVLFEMKITKPVPGVHLAAHNGHDGEQEVVMPAQTFWKITGFRKGDGKKKNIVTMETA